MRLAGSAISGRPARVRSPDLGLAKALWTTASEELRVTVQIDELRSG